MTCNSINQALAARDRASIPRSKLQCLSLMHSKPPESDNYPKRRRIYEEDPENGTELPNGNGLRPGNLCLLSADEGKADDFEPPDSPAFTRAEDQDDNGGFGVRRLLDFPVRLRALNDSIPGFRTGYQCTRISEESHLVPNALLQKALF